MQPVFFIKRDLILFLEEFDIFSFVWHNKTKRTSLSCNSCGSAHSVDVFFDIAAKVPLDNPSDTFKIEASRSDISANKHRFFSLVKSKIVLLSLFLLHVSVQLLNIAVKKQLFLLLRHLVHPQEKLWLNTPWPWCTVQKGAVWGAKR